MARLFHHQPESYLSMVCVFSKRGGGGVEWCGSGSKRSLEVGRCIASRRVVCSSVVRPSSPSIWRWHALRKSSTIATANES